MQVFSTNELEVQKKNSRTPRLYLVIVILLLYLILYILIPFRIFSSMFSFFLSFLLSFIPGEAPFGIKVFTGLEVSLPILILYIFYKQFIDAIFYVKGISIKKEWINYLTFKKLKIEYYQEIMGFVKSLNTLRRCLFIFIKYIFEITSLVMSILGVALIVLYWFLICAVFWSICQEELFGLSVWKSISSLNYSPDLSSDLTHIIFFLLITAIITAISLFILTIILALASSIPIKCIFPTRKGKIDASDVPISFIKDAIENLESFNFSCSLAEKQDKKKQIIARINYALEHFLKVNNPNEAFDPTNICYILIVDQFNKSVRKDILFRANGLYKEIDKLCVEVNNMSSPEEQNRIVNDLKMYLKVIKDRDLSKIEPVEFEMKKSDFTSFIIQTISFLNKIL